jgi:LmbE family N-acetylglucosaminyl deacetylase
VVAFTVVSFHAHPDDEALLTGGTLARAAADGHRVVIVTATNGAAGLSEDPTDLGGRRTGELEQAAAALGCTRLAILGYHDSGSQREPVPPGPGEPMPFALLDPREPAERLAALLREERADVLTIYDPNGGYGHPDHVQVHRVGLLAAGLAGTPVVLEATVDRTPLMRVARLLRRIPVLSRLIPESGFADAYLDRSELTHRVDVRAHLAAKRAALAAHASQAGGGGVRTLRLLLALPGPLARRVLGQEWFREQGRAPESVLSDDIFATLR